MLVIAWTGVLILAIEIIAFYYYFDIDLKINPFSNIFFNLLVFIACYLVIAFFLPFLGSFVYKRQILSTAFLALCYASIFFSLQLMMLLIVVTSISTKEFTIGFPKYSPIFVPLFIVETVLSFIYHYLWLKRQLKNGFSINRTVGNYFAKSSVYSRNSLHVRRNSFRKVDSYLWDFWFSSFQRCVLSTNHRGYIPFASKNSEQGILGRGS